MNAIRVLIVLSVAVLATACANPGHSSAAHAPPGKAGMQMGSADSMAAKDPRMVSMRDMHQRMTNARTPAERQALMADHMKAMQGGMAMMKDMHGQHGQHGASAMAGMKPTGSASAASPTAGGCDGKEMHHDMGKRHRMMADHMDTMQMMMDMMGDRLPPASVNK
ncbi:MAG: hypothetical protein Q8R33_16725 [Burkholderiales bacterium]|nr:hypothetical protein [Burkholderiales bacterium]